MTGAVEATMETLAVRGILGESGFRRLAQRREGERPRTVSSGNGYLNGAVDMHVPPAGAQHRADEELLATCPRGTVRRTSPESVLTRPSSLAESSKVWNSLHSTAAASAPPRSPHRASDDIGDGLPPPLPPPRTNSIGNSSNWPQVTRPAAKGSAEKSILRGDLSNVLNFDEAPDETAATRRGTFSTLGQALAPPELLSMAPIARPSPRSSLGGGGWASTRHQEVHLASSSSSSSAVGSPAHGGSSQQHRHQRVAGSTTSDRLHVSSPPTGSRSADLSISPVSELISSPASHASDADAARPPTFISKSPVFVFRGSTSPSSSNWHSNGTSACSSPLPGQSGAHAGSDEGSGGTGEAAGGRGGEGETRDCQNGKRKRRVPSKQPNQEDFPGGDVPSIVRAAIEVFTPGKTKSGVKTPGRSSVQADCLDSKGGGLDKKEIDSVIGTCVIGANRPEDKDGEVEKGGGSEEAAGMIITKMWRTTDVKRPLFSLHGDRNSDTFHELKEQQSTTPDEAHVSPVLDGGDGPFTCSQGKEEQDQKYSWGLVLKTSAGKADGDVVGDHARTVPKGGTLTRLTCMDRASTNHGREARQWASPLSPQPFIHSPHVTSSRPTSPLSPRPSANVKMSQSMDTGGRMAERKLQSSLDHSFGHESESLFRRSSSDEHQRMARANAKDASSALGITAMTRANALVQKKLRTVSFELLQSEQHVMEVERELRNSDRTNELLRRELGRLRQFVAHIMREHEGASEAEAKLAYLAWVQNEFDDARELQDAVNSVKSMSIDFEETRSVVEEDEGPCAKEDGTGSAAEIQAGNGEGATERDVRPAVASCQRMALAAGSDATPMKTSVSISPDEQGYAVRGGGRGFRSNVPGKKIVAPRNDQALL